jgi:hypothetical protein
MARLDRAISSDKLNSEMSWSSWALTMMGLNFRRWYDADDEPDVAIAVARFAVGWLL